MSAKKPIAETLDDPKVRDCLACQRAFDSAWAGERICPKCKSSSAWRGGTNRQFPAAKRSD